MFIPLIVNVLRTLLSETLFSQLAVHALWKAAASPENELQDDVVRTVADALGVDHPRRQKDD